MKLTMEMERDKLEEQEETKNAAIAEVHGNEHVVEDAYADDSIDDHASESHDDEHDSVDYTSLNKSQLVEVLKDLIKRDQYKQSDKALREIKPVMDELREKERAEKLMKFIADGGVEEDFDYKGDEQDHEFDALYKQIREKRTEYLKSQEENKNDNLRKKQELLERIRVFIDSPEANDHFDTFKELQKEWKAIGPVPGSQARTLWANYHALVDRFYDNQSIYFELKELDRKKNLEAKLEICARAEKLAEVEKIKDAIRELNELHHEFKHIGPVPLESKESLWQRFKSASDAVYVRRDQYLEQLQQELNINFDSKNALSEEAESFASFQSDRIKEWNQKTKEILELQKKWETVGGLPRAKAKDVNKKFWSAFKTFFNNKNAFFKRLDEEREQNLQLKNDLVKKAIELKESQDWEKTSNELKMLQQKWKDIGPVPERYREKVFQEFKEACDFFFEQRRTQQGKVENEQTSNLKLKEEICDELVRHAEAGTSAPNLLRILQEKYNSIGFVPRKDMNNIRNRYHQSVQQFIDSIQGFTEDDKNRLLLENQISDLKHDPMGDRKLYQKEQAIRKKISKVENDIALWRNNIEFFSGSKTADKVKDEFNEKINAASEQLRSLKEQLKMLKTSSQ